MTPSEAGLIIKSYVRSVERYAENNYVDDMQGRRMKTYDKNVIGQLFHKVSFCCAIVKYCTTAEKYSHLLKSLHEHRRLVGTTWNEYCDESSFSWNKHMEERVELRVKLALKEALKSQMRR